MEAGLSSLAASATVEAFVARRSGAWEYASEGGRQAADREGVERIEHQIAEAIRSFERDGGTPAIVVPLAHREAAERGWLVVLRASSTPADAEAERWSAACRTWRLTARQCDVLRLIARGEGNKTIAELLGCALSTVEIHVSAIYKKAQVETRIQLVTKVYAL